MGKNYVEKIKKRRIVNMYVKNVVHGPTKIKNYANPKK